LVALHRDRGIGTDADTSEKEIIENISSIPGRGNIDEPGGLKEGRQPELDFLANPLCLELEKTINWLLKRPRRGGGRIRTPTVQCNLSPAIRRCFPAPCRFFHLAAKFLFLFPNAARPWNIKSLIFLHNARPHTSIASFLFHLFSLSQHV